jgi:hypothetical protein
MNPSAAPLTSEVDILTAALATLTERLPSDWKSNIQREAAAGRHTADAVVTITAPGGARATLYAEVKRSVVTRDLPAMVEQVQTYIDTAASPRREGAKPLLVARYLAPPLQQWLTERDIPYADAAGNIRVSLREPAMFVRDVGAQRDPWRGPGRPKGNLTGASAARVVRDLVDFRPPYTVPALMKLAGTPSGNTYRGVDFIEEQDLLTRADDGKITEVRWRALLERWSKDYSFSKLAVGSTYLAPRGLPDLMKRLARLTDDDEAGRYAVTGSLATPKWEAYAPAKNAMIYADNPKELAAWADLRRVEAGANVLIARAGDTASLYRAQRLDGTVIVAPSQAAVDLLTAPGRGPEEGRALLDWMEKNESDWRQ